MTADPLLVFDLETIPDVAAARRLHDYSGLTDDEVVDAMTTLRRIETGSGFLSHPLHRVVSIGVLYRSPNGGALRLSALGRDGEDEAGILSRFFSILERKTPTLVSWNGGGFDLPVLHYRALLHGVAAPRYWEMGEHDSQFRFRNYISRFHWRHIDLMDVLSGYQQRARTRLDTMATLLGFPGKLGMDGSRVWSAWRESRHAAIHDYVEHDVLNTYLIYLRFERMRGSLSAERHTEAEAELRAFLEAESRPGLDEFLAAWSPAEPGGEG